MNCSTAESGGRTTDGGFRPAAWCRLLLVALLLAGMAACGNKGDLYLPDESAPAADEAP